ncbi:MAG: response regulator [Anaerolineales bacterium]|jgi:two-component system cell cycle response regulator CpdR
MNQLAILIVEDETKLASTLAQALRLGSDGAYRVDTCESAEQAYPLLEENPYDVLISDYRLPGEDGLSLAVNVQTDKPDTQTILITGYGSPELESHADRVTRGYLAKPFDMLDLLMMVQKVITPGEYIQGKAIKQSDLEEKNKGRILVLEDDYGQRQIYLRALRNAGYTVDEAPTLNDARKHLAKNDYALLICDFQLGRERGLDLLVKFRDQLKKAGTRVMMCSAHPQYRYLTEEIGVDYFLEKPVSLSTLITMVNRLLSTNRDKSGG